LDIATKPQDTTAENILERLSDLQNHPDEEEVVPYREFNVDGKLYYFTPGGFLYRREPGTEEVGGFFCGYLTDRVWGQPRVGLMNLRVHTLSSRAGPPLLNPALLAAPALRFTHCPSPMAPGPSGPPLAFT
jgi:hypothetical protein